MSNVGTPESYERNKLRGRIVEKYRSQAAFAKEIGITKYALSRKMTGKTTISQDDMIRWCVLLDIDRDEIGEYFFT